MRYTNNRGIEVIGTPDFIAYDRLSLSTLSSEGEGRHLRHIDINDYFNGYCRIEIETENGFEDIKFYS